MSRFFSASAETYEAIRTAMDAASGFPNAQATTWFTPAASAPRDSDGNCLIAAIPPIASHFAVAGAEEITAEDYAASFHTPAPGFLP
jgi:hypothetical protein